MLVILIHVQINKIRKKIKNVTRPITLCMKINMSQITQCCIEPCCIFKTALLVYKYLHTNCPKYFSPFLKVRQCAYNTRLSQSDGIILHVPQYQPSIYKSTKQFGLSFAYDAPKIWNELPDNVRSATSIASFRKKLKAYLFCQAYPP